MPELPHDRTLARALTIDLQTGEMAICRLAHDAPIPAWATDRPFFTVTRTHDELSIICAAAQVPGGVTASRGWRLLVLRGPFSFGLVGILLAVAEPLARAGVSIMPVASHDTDHVLVQAPQLARAIAALRAAGHEVTGDDVEIPGSAPTTL